MAERELEVSIAKLEERVVGLERWQDRQNGSLERLEKRIDEIDRRVHQILVSVLIALISSLLGAGFSILTNLALRTIQR